MYATAAKTWKIEVLNRFPRVRTNNSLTFATFSFLALFLASSSSGSLLRFVTLQRLADAALPSSLKLYVYIYMCVYLCL